MIGIVDSGRDLLSSTNSFQNELKAKLLQFMVTFAMDMSRAWIATWVTQFSQFMDIARGPVIKMRYSIQYELIIRNSEQLLSWSV